MSGYSEKEIERIKNNLAATIRKAILNFGIKPRIRGELYVTDLVNCPRRTFFNVRFNANPITTEGSALVGRALHRMLSDMLKDVFPDAEFEVPVKYEIGGGWYIVGRIDMVVGNDVYEFKFGTNYQYNEAKVLHVQQANAYAVMYGASRWWLINIDRKNLIVDVDTGEPDQKMFGMLIARAQRIIQSIINDTVPAGPDFDWECKHCPYNIICKRWKEWITQKPLEG